MDIVEATLADLPQFFEYLERQLEENADENTPLFQPVAKAHSPLTDQLKAKFRNGFHVPFGESGWRKLWLVKDSNNTIRGHIDLRHHSDDYTFHRVLIGMGVDRRMRKQGIGKQLLDCVVQFCNAHSHIDWLDLQVLSDNIPAKYLYLTRGFNTIGEITDLYRIDGKSVSEITMTVSTIKE
ncbi:GNAT family N-acetyltransferase [Enterovibrio calviensis]|uniref:GNAT family N-acetyltransferase n=1 Tax=Enterovibrio calviensis TaxID=91359 RepID=UPI00047F3249|nr:GNAT family N-acetyltransferase [Enterovibrio calviensis]